MQALGARVLKRFPSQEVRDKGQTLHAAGRRPILIGSVSALSLITRLTDVVGFVGNNLFGDEKTALIPADQAVIAGYGDANHKTVVP
jgi:hypothetical protein